MANAPIKKFRLGFLSASVWENTSNGRTFHTVDVQRSYKDGGELKNTSSLGHADLLNAAHLLQRCEAYISEL